MSKIFKTSEEIEKAFVNDGWSKNIEFSELTAEEAKEKGYLFAISGISKGHKFFKMKKCGNIYNDKGEICYFNI